jgi:hypothetical protein
VIGGLISVLNFRALTRIVASAVQPGGSQAAVAAKIMVKFLGLMLAVTATLLWCPVDSIAFVAGISLTFVSFGLSGMLRPLRSASVNPESTDA